MRRLLLRGLQTLRDTWLVIGVTIGLIAMLEGGYRLQAAARRALRAPDPWVATGPLSPRHPNAAQPWWREVSSGAMKVEGGGLRYDPFRGWWPRAQRSQYINVDSLGRRVTIQPPIIGQPRVVYLFGGSAMWIHRS